MIKNCSKCNQDFDVRIDRDGIVLNDSVFVCSPCIRQTSREEMHSWMCDQLGMSNNFRPINLWLFDKDNYHEHNE